MPKSTKNTNKVSKPKMRTTNGRADTFEPTTLDQVWGDTGLSRYKTMELDTYLSQLNEMNLSDLQRHALSVQVMPIDDRKRLLQRLTTAFKSYASQYRKPKLPKVDNLASKMKEIPEHIKKIMAQGR